MPRFLVKVVFTVEAECEKHAEEIVVSSINPAYRVVSYDIEEIDYY